jgi:anti-anti-sigma factor
MNIEIKRLGTVDVIMPHGPLVDEDAETLIATLQQRLAAPNPRFVIDLADVPYLDSRSIEGIVDAADDLRKRGGRLRLASVTQTCREVFELTGQSQRVEYFDDAQSAVRSFL